MVQLSHFWNFCYQISCVLVLSWTTGRSSSLWKYCCISFHKVYFWVPF